jgi:hypothetical protein
MRPITRRLLAAVAAVAAATVCWATAPAQALTPGLVPVSGPAIEDFAPYQPQVGCATRIPKGTGLLAAWLLTRYPVSSNWGIMRSCSTKGVTEHKEGRAFDWHVDHRNKAQRAAGESFMKLMFATDRYGNKDALARRMGIMYVIWDNKIYGAYSGFVPRPYLSAGCDPARLAACNPTQQHVDHMHLSLTWSGSRGLTSFYDGTVAGPGEPPPPPVLNQTVHPVVRGNVGAGSPVRTTYSLKAGITYRIVATGYYAYGAGLRMADASCSWHRRDDVGWSQQAESATSATTLRLTVNGAAGWVPVRGNGGCDTATHTYVWDYRPSSTGAATIAIDDPSPWDARGALSYTILRAGAAVSGYRTPAPAPPAPPVAPASLPAGPELSAPETVTVDAASPGAWTTGALVAGRPYTVEVSGTWWAGDDRLTADAVCTAVPSGAWQLRRTNSPLSPDVDGYGLYVDGEAVAATACSSDHTYRWTFTPHLDGRALLTSWDLVRSDDVGTLRVTIAPQVG